MSRPLISAIPVIYWQIRFPRCNLQFHHSCATLLDMTMKTAKPTADYFPSKCPEQFWGLPKLPIQCVQRALFPGVKWLRHDSNHLPPSSALAKMSAAKHFTALICFHRMHRNISLFTPPHLWMQIKCILMNATMSKYRLVKELTFEIQYCLPAIIQFGV